ncbi:SGNH/GDSL hydrolase family protein [Cellulomonas sp. PhB143]|uniref:SGNH/GDSL hydrolase family protein n=1 Tax=Cellulomonas sp. PhB143 TaxID=2485186 RepID=UPI000F4AF4A6|nr:SGNH/GDSL hydrolase family protein [Cellulomonas sp. PhB143]ROS78781.1 lysophospholipase L1-like esterase [Cellulomonas sp. PhB143]
MVAVSTNDDAPRWSSYVALGDSFTEGLWDPYPSDPDHQRGWADRLARTLSDRREAAGLEPLRYANTAIRGRTLRPIIVDQVPRAIEMRPDLVSLIGGGNDILRPRADIDRLARNLEHGVVRLREAGIDVLLGTGFDAKGGMVAMTRPRAGVFNALIWSMARRHGAYVVDLWGMRALGDWRMWSDDRIHLVPEGHRRVRDAALVGLGLAPEDPNWDVPLDALPPTPAVERVKANAEWARVHLAPWVRRRVTHRSSGDARTEKQAALGPVPAETDEVTPADVG